MTDNLNFFWLIGCLVLAVSALAAHRISFGLLIRSLIGWGAIIALVAIGVSKREQIKSALGDVADQMGLSEQQAVGDTVRIAMGPDGHFWARVRLNGFTKRMLIDSGATITALSDETARNARIPIDTSAFPMEISTANGSVAAQRGVARSVSIGEVKTGDLDVVVSPNFGDTDVIGMNFLSRLKSWRVEGQTLILEPKREGDRPTSSTDA